MNLSAETIAIVALAAAGGVVVLLALVLFLTFRLGRLRKAYASALDPSRREDLFESVQRQSEDLAALRDDLLVVHDNTQHLRDLLGRTVSRVGLVRYDAFEDMGGALSFSAAFLDEHQDGVVVSAINGRSETRCYAKPIQAGTSVHHLSEEEKGAIAAAVSGDRGEMREVAGSGRRGRRRAS